ncbi:hypothetical protein K458DRAFT_490904 [Lentithecium fluviatile CBS 122367]|uniref:Uncharacterized protein n=1 Tax=Lentithecium fluviatile CBS 122367 TaxID=1168545 RepID=A0A6G1ILP4_9PLEO|nr:hypothetical protein K458DRAFT_490904 [Lentithecium fluviatile CBS 122367]
MLIFSACRSLLVLGLLCSLASVLALPRAHGGGLALRDDNDSDNSWSAVPLEERNPAKAKAKPKPKPTKKPTAAPKPTKKPTVTKKPTTALKTSAKPSVKPSSKATPKPTPRPTPKPTPSKSSSIKWPKIPVPYPTTAFDVCDIYVPCGEEVDLLAARNANAAAMVVMTAAPATTDAPQGEPSKEKRDIRTFKVTLAPGDVVTILNLDYPSSPQLYSHQEVAKNTFDFKSNRLDDASVKNTKREPTAAEMPDFVTEHIIELQTIALFMRSVLKNNAQVQAFFRTHWQSQLDPNQVRNRAFKPSYYTSTMTPRTTMNDLIFEAIGSNNNLKDFVMCESQINSFKQRMWSSNSPMENDRYKKAVLEAIDGLVPSNQYLSALRATISVYRYMQEPEVKRRMEQAITNVEIELKNIQGLTGQNVDLSRRWRAFMKDHMAAMDTKNKIWLKNRITRDTKKQVQRGLTKYRAMLSDLRVKEKGPSAATHSNKQATEKTRLEAEQAQKAADVQVQEQKIVSVRSEITDLTTKMRTARGAAFTTLDTSRKAKRKQLGAEKKTLDTKKKLHGEISRKLQELYSGSVEQIVKNLERDQKLVTNYEAAIRRISMPEVPSASGSGGPNVAPIDNV